MANPSDISKMLSSVTTCMDNGTPLLRRGLDTFKFIDEQTRGADSKLQQPYACLEAGVGAQGLNQY